MHDIDTLMERYSGQVPGASLLVIRDGKAVVRRAYGMADMEGHVGATPSTNYRLASVTKQFTAAAIARHFHWGTGVAHVDALNHGGDREQVALQPGPPMLTSGLIL